jgi:hypothetical protein
LAFWRFGILNCIGYWVIGYWLLVIGNWLLVIGYYWLLLVIIGYYWLLLVIIGLLDHWIIGSLDHWALVCCFAVSVSMFRSSVFVYYFVRISWPVLPAVKAKMENGMS